MLHRHDGLRYVIARPQHGPAIAAILARSFVNEPMSRALGLDEHTLARIVGRFAPECVSNGLSVIAIPEDELHPVAGALINQDYKSDVPRAPHAELLLLERVLAGGAPITHARELARA